MISHVYLMCMGGEMISSLASVDDLERKLLRRVA